MRRALPILLACLVLGGCTAAPAPMAAPDPETTVGSPGHPVLLVAYTPNEQVRVRFEDRLRGDLAAAGIEALAGHDLIEIDLLLDTAERRAAPMILMVRRLITELPGDGTAPPPEVRRHRTLREYFGAADRTRLPDLPPPGRQVVEVAGYLRNGRRTELVWSGYSWVAFDGDLDAAIRETAEIIAGNLAPACQGISCDFRETP